MYIFLIRVALYVITFVSKFAGVFLQTSGSAITHSLSAFSSASSTNFSSQSSVRSPLQRTPPHVKPIVKQDTSKIPTLGNDKDSQATSSNELFYF